MKWSNIKELLMHILFFLTACVSIFAVVLICVFLFANGIPAIGKIGVFKFLLGTKWKPGNDIYGILPMILGSLYVTAGAIIIGVPIGLLTAVFLAKFCPKGLYKILKPATELMAGVPSVVYGFFGLVVLVPLVQNIFGVAGNTMLTASVLLGIMILPTIIGVSESAIRAVPDSYYEGSLALGASHVRIYFLKFHTFAPFTAISPVPSIVWSPKINCSPSRRTETASTPAKGNSAACAYRSARSSACSSAAFSI